jgi:c-di-GMP-related signal transduction protein
MVWRMYSGTEFTQSPLEGLKMIHTESRQFVRALVTTALVTIFATPQSLIAQSSEHLVSPTELQKAVVDASEKRQQNLDALDQFFSSEKAQRALESAHQNPEQVKKAVASLSDDELAQLASRANKAQTDFSAGRMDDHDLLIVLVCIAALVLIIVAVH